MNTSHKNNDASLRNKDQTGIRHACPCADLNPGEDILPQEGSMRRLRAQRIRVHKMVEFETNCDAIFPGIRREIIALYKSAQFVALQEMKAAEMRLEAERSLTEEERIKKLPPDVQEFAKLDSVDRFLIYQLRDQFFEMVFYEADDRETGTKLGYGKQQEEDVTSAGQLIGNEDLDQATVPSTANYSEDVKAEVDVNAEVIADPREMSALDVLSDCLRLQRERLHRMTELQENLSCTLPAGYQEFEAERKISEAVRKLEPAIRKEKAERADRKRSAEPSDREAKLDRINLRYPDLIPQVVESFRAMLSKEDKAAAEEKDEL